MICIVTVYKSNNSGSYLQAKALYSVLKKYDENVVFLDFGQRRMKNIQEALISILKLQKKRILRVLMNSYFWGKLPTVKPSKIKELANIVFVIGSDEIWNIARKNIQYPFFFGSGLNGKRISYAVSVNTASIEDFLKFKFTQEINNFVSLSVRDTYSQKVVNRLTGKEVELVLDPTFLFGKDYYCEGIKIHSLPYKYIAVYSFSEKEFSNQIDAIRNYAESRNLVLVSIGLPKKWCDRCVVETDFNPFIYYIDAELVVTSTFHGTAFAINFEKQFVVLSKENKKVIELINEFGLCERNIYGKDNAEIVRILDSKIDFRPIKKELEKKRALSLEYLKNSLT